MVNSHVFYFGHSKLKPMDSVAFFKLHEESSALTESIASSTVSQKEKTASTTSSTNFKKTSHETSGQIAPVN